MPAYRFDDYGRAAHGAGAHHQHDQDAAGDLLTDRSPQRWGHGERKPTGDARCGRCGVDCFPGDPMQSGEEMHVGLYFKRRYPKVDGSGPVLIPDWRRPIRERSSSSSR